MTRESKVATKLKLPTEYNEPPDDFLAYFCLIFGRKNIGKSTLGSSWPNSINFQLERGRKNLPILMVPRKGEKPLTLKTFGDYFKLFCESEHEAAVIDTLDALYDMIYSGVLRRYGESITKPQDTRDGPGVWNEIKYVLDDFISQAQDAGKTLIFISHERSREHNNADGTVLERIEPSCTGQAIAVVQRYCDYVFHYDWVTNDRVITVRSTDNIVWTSCGRNETFLDPDGEELKRIKIPNNPDLGFDTLERAFKGELRDYDWQPPKKQTNNKPARKPAMAKK